MRFVGRGHPAIRATHHKTLELSSDPQLTERATCVIAVAAEPEPPAPLAGPVRIRIAAGSERFTLAALANSSWDPRGPAVIRRSPLRLPGTFATDASAVSSELPRPLVRALQDPDSLVTVDVLAIPAREPTVVLFAADPFRGPDERLRAELERADTVIAEDADARRLVGSARSAISMQAPGRTLVVSTRELPGRTCADRLAGAALETVGLPAPLAVAAACPSRSPLTLGSDLDLLRTTPAAHRLVLPVEPDRLAALLERAGAHRGTQRATVMQEFGRPQPASAGDLPELAGRDLVYCCLHPVPVEEAVDPAARAAIGALLADGVPTKTVAKALAALTRWERRRAYDAIVNWPAS